MLSHRSPHSPTAAHGEATCQCSVAVALVFVAILALGAHGFSIARPDSRPADCLMLSAQLFALHSNVPEHAPHRLPWTLEVARFAAPAFTAGGLVFLSAAAGWVFRRCVGSTRPEPANTTEPASDVVVVILGAKPSRPTDAVTLTTFPPRVRQLVTTTRHSGS